MADSEQVPLPNLTTQGAQLPPAQPQAPAQAPQQPLTGPVQGTPTGGRKRGGKKQAPPPEPPPAPAAPPTEDEIGKLALALGGAFKLVFSMIASRRGKHWLMQDEERDVLGMLWAPALAPWLQAYGKYVALAVAVLGTASVVQPRLERDAELATELQEKEKERNAENPNAAGRAADHN